MSSSALRPWLVLLTFIVVGFILYSPSLATPFIFDDDRTVSMNDNIMHLWPADWLTKETRPMGSLTFAINYQLHGLSLRGFHLTNTAIHVLAAWVLFLLVELALTIPGRSFFSPAKAQSLAFAAAMLWLVHPLNTQAVSYIAQRYESQMGLFFLVTLYCMARGAFSASASKWTWYAAAIAAGWFGMLSKEVMATLLIVAPLFDRAFLAATWKEVFAKRGWVYAAIVPSLVIVLFLQRGILNPAGAATASAGFALQGVSAWEYFRTQPEIILHYLGLAVLPRQLIFDYGWHVQNDLLRAGVSGLVVTAIFVGSVLLYLRRPAWGFAALSFFLILGPTSSFMPIADLAVEHRMYLPLIAVCLAAVFLGNAWLERLVANDSTRQRLAFSLAVVALAMLSLRTYVRNEDYREPIRLYAQNVRINPTNRRAHNNLALELRARGLNAEARQHFEAAAKLDPRHPHAFYQLGLLAAEEQNLQLALDFFMQSLERAPHDRAAEYCCGLCYLELKRDADAAAAFERSLAIDPKYAVSQRELAWTLATSEDDQIRDGARSLKIAEDLARRRPNDPRLLEVLAAANAAVGKYQEAADVAEKALASAERSGWKEAKRAALAAAIEQYRAERPFRRSHAVEVVKES